MKAVLETFIILALILLVIWIILAKLGLFIIPQFLLPKASQQLSKGESCQELPELWKRNMCYSTAASLRKEATLCEKIIISDQDPVSVQNKGLCYQNVARITRNPDLCQQAGSFREECLREANSW